MKKDKQLIKKLKQIFPHVSIEYEGEESGEDYFHPMTLDWDTIGKMG